MTRIPDTGYETEKCFRVQTCNIAKKINYKLAYLRYLYWIILIFFVPFLANNIWQPTKVNIQHAGVGPLHQHPLTLSQPDGKQHIK